MKTIAEFQKAAYALAVERGEYSRPCDECAGRKLTSECTCCGGEGRMPIDHRSPTRIAARLERIHRAIGDAGSCVSHGWMDVKWGTLGGKPVLKRSFPIALATVFLRLCGFEYSTLTERDREHVAHSHLTEGRLSAASEATFVNLAYLHSLVGSLYGKDPSWEDHNNHSELITPLWELHCMLFGMAKAHGFDLFEMAELKLEYERGRK